MTGAVRWCTEIAGVAIIAVAASLWWLPLGIALVGVYLIVAANVEVNDDSTTNSSP